MASHHFPDGALVIVGEVKEGCVSVCALAGGNPGCSITFRAPARAMAAFFGRAGLVAMRVGNGRRSTKR